MIKTIKGFGRPDVKNKCFLGSNPNKIKPGSMIAYNNIHQYCHGNTVQTSVTNEYSMYKSPKVYSSKVLIEVNCNTQNYVIEQAILLGKTYSGKQVTLSKLTNLQVKNVFRYNFTFSLQKPVFIGNNQGYKNSTEWIKSLQVQFFGTNLPPTLYIIQKPELKMVEHFKPAFALHKEAETMSPIRQGKIWMIVGSLLFVLLICFIIFIFCTFK